MEVKLLVQATSRVVPTVSNLFMSISELAFSEKLNVASLAPGPMTTCKRKMKNKKNVTSRDSLRIREL